MRIPPRLALAAVVVLVNATAAEQVWRLDNVREFGGHIVVVEGQPRVVEMEGAQVVVFDGMKDGLFVRAIPFADRQQFTIEILFRPAEGGPAEQRFLHAQDTKGSRALLETRLDGKGGWWLDTFIATPETGIGVALIDPKRVHPTDRWYWAALRYDGKTMAHFVNGQKELEREARFAPFGSGKISLGVRQNKLHWFKGAIREVRFHTEAIAEEKLHRLK